MKKPTRALCLPRRSPRSPGRLLRAAPLTVALLLPLSAAAFTTIGLLANTVEALPSCLHYQVKGVCFFLHCKKGICTIRTSIRVKHYLPEAVVSTYANPTDHPWIEIGMPISTAAWELGSGILSAILPSGILGLDGSGETTAPLNRAEKVTFKSADVYGNPAADIEALFTGQIPAVNRVTLPGTSELSDWVRNVLPRIIRSIRNAGSEFRGAVAQGLSHLAKTPEQLAQYLEKIPTLIGNITRVFNSSRRAMSNIAELPRHVSGGLQNLASGRSGNFSLGSIGNLTGGLSNSLGDIETTLVNRLLGPLAGAPGTENLTLQEMGYDLQLFTNELSPFNGIDLSIAGIDLSVLGQIQEITGGLFCPPTSRPFTPHFISEFDAITWRSLLPLEMLDARSWTPGATEVSTNPASHSWGSVYPRVGELVQYQPVRASAVLAERARSIVTQRQQPHIYTPMERSGSWKYFSANGEARWQMLHPRSSGSCMKFGSLTWGDGEHNYSDDRAYAWNMWEQYDCCKKRGSFLFSIP